MMEEVEYKLKKENVVLVANAVSTLVDTIIQKWSDAADKTTVTQLKEFQLLKSKCEDKNLLVSMTACQGLVTLSEMGILPNTLSTLCTLVSIETASSTRGQTGAVPSIASLLIINLKKQLTNSEPYNCPFNLCSPKHPLVILLKKNRHIWFDVLNQMQHLCSHTDPLVSAHSLEMLWPVFVYILCDPTEKGQLSCCQQAWDLLLKVLVQPKAKALLTNILVWFQVESELDLFYTSLMTQRLAEVALQLEDGDLCLAIASNLASVIHTLVSKGQDPRSCLTTLATLVKKHKETSSCVILLLSETLTICPVVYLQSLTDVCVMIIREKTCNAVSAKACAYALLQWLRNPSSMINDALMLASDVINLAKEDVGWGCHTGRLSQNRMFRQVAASDTRVHLAVELCKLADAWQSGSGDVCEWLDRVSACPPHFSSRLDCFLAGLYLHNFGQESVKHKCLELLVKLVDKKHELAGSVLALILYALGNEVEPHAQLELLHALCQMAVQNENIVMILHTFETLKVNPCLRGVVVDLYTRLWCVEKRCFPYLQKLFLENVKLEENDMEGWEFEVAKAAAIAKICLMRPELHGAELVPLMSQILNRHNSAIGSVPSALALEGIAALCEAQIAEVTSTWKVLAPKLSKDKRPAVVKSLCQFFAIVPSIHNPSHEFDKLVTEVTTKLWSLVSPTQEIDVVKAALSALSKFKPSQIGLKTLPERFRRKLKLPPAYCKTPADAARRPEDVLPYVPSGCWVQMLENIHPLAREAAGDMLASWLNAEVAAYRGGVYQISARQEEPQDCNHLPASSVWQGLASHVLHVSQRHVEDVDLPVVRECLRILSQDYPKHLPTLNVTPLEALLECDEQCTRFGLAMLSKQAAISPSARRVVEKYITNFRPSSQNKEAILMLFSNLGDFCKGVPPNTLRPFIESSLQVCLNAALKEEGADSDCVTTFKQLMNLVKQALQREDIHDANRTLLAIIIESLVETLPLDGELLDSYINCAVELPTKHLERMTSPSVWWETTPEKLRFSVKFRSALALRSDTDIPLVWLNECIDAAATMKEEHINVLRSIASVMVDCRDHSKNSCWILELMGQIQTVITNKTHSDNPQAVTFLCDIFIVAVITLSAYDCLSQPVESISNSRDTRLQLFPQALKSLLSTADWADISTQILQWLHHMQLCSILPTPYNQTFYETVVALRNNAYVKRHVWMEVINNRVIKGNALAN